MINGKKVLAVIQARGGSKGIPLKNIYKLAGHPLISYTIYAAKNSQYIDNLIISTDSVEIKKVSLIYQAITPFMRPKKLAGDKVTSYESLHYSVKRYEKICKCKYDYIIELPCVSPFRSEEDIDRAIEKLDKTGADSVISVCNTGEKHPIRLKRIVNDKIKDFTKEYPEPYTGSRRQDLEECYIRNGAIYSMKRATLFKHKNRNGRDSRPYIMDIERSINIDEKFDLKIAELLIKSGLSVNQPWKIKLNKFFFEDYSNQSVLITTPTHYLKNFQKKIKNKKKFYINSNLTKKDIIRIIPYVKAWICSPCPRYKIDKNILVLAKKLKIISSPSTGLSHIDLKSCKDFNIEVKSISDSKKVNNIKASSEFTFSLILNLIKKINQSFDNVKIGKWREEEDSLRSIQLKNKIIGIIGLGRIGYNIAKYSLSFGMKPYYFDLFDKQVDKKIKFCKSLNSLLKVSDIVVVCLKHNPQTNKIIGKKEFIKMKNNVYFVNTSRGEVIDEKALLINLNNKKIKAASIDVLSNEQSMDLSNNNLVNYLLYYS